MEKQTIDFGAEEQLTHVAQLIHNKITEFDKFSLEEIREFVKIRLDQIMEVEL